MRTLVSQLQVELRDLVAMMDERGVVSAHTTILRWVQYYTPEFAKRRRMDETYVKVRGAWVYLYQVVDKAGKMVDFDLSRKRDVDAAKAFLRKAMEALRTPTKITLDANAASQGAVADLKQSGELPKRVRVRSCKYLNNIIEQDHRRAKQRLRPMLGLKSFQTAAVIIGGLERAEKIKKGQFKIGTLGARWPGCRKSGRPPCPRNPPLSFSE